jgi:hypothetical protein
MEEIFGRDETTAAWALGLKDNVYHRAYTNMSLVYQYHWMQYIDHCKAILAGGPIQNVWSFEVSDDIQPLFNVHNFEPYYVIDYV